MAKRKAPGALRADVVASIPVDKHQDMLSQMHDALYSLGDKIRKPFGSGQGEKLLPASLHNSETPESKAARGHIETLFGAMKGAKKEGK